MSNNDRITAIDICKQSDANLLSLNVESYFKFCTILNYYRMFKLLANLFYLFSSTSTKSQSPSRLLEAIATKRYARRAFVKSLLHMLTLRITKTTVELNDRSVFCHVRFHEAVFRAKI